jgi:hypothetical protein
MKTPNGWKPQHDIASRPAWMGEHCLTPNAIEMDFGDHVNGSGPGAFGGAERWPHLTIHIGFEVGQEEMRDAVAIILARMIDNLMPIPERKEKQ